MKKGYKASDGDAQDCMEGIPAPAMHKRPVPRAVERDDKDGALQGLISCEGFDMTVAVSQWLLLARCSSTLPYKIKVMVPTGPTGLFVCLFSVTGHSHLHLMSGTLCKKRQHIHKNSYC